VDIGKERTRALRDALWAVDINHGGAALFIGLLLSREQPMVYITGLAGHQASAAYHGQGKADEKDAFVIADQAHMPQMSVSCGPAMR
jgi:hypothetical protein